MAPATLHSIFGKSDSKYFLNGYTILILYTKEEREIAKWLAQNHRNDKISGSRPQRALASHTQCPGHSGGEGVTGLVCC
jgi:hypothetical protein